MNIYKLPILLLPLFLAACGGGGSSVVAATVDPGVQQVPPSIGLAIKSAESNGTLPVLNRDSTLSGPDIDGNGVRDDIDVYITSLPDTASQKASLRQSAAALGNSLTVDVTNKAALLAVSDQISSASWCGYNRYTPAIASKKNHEMEKLIVNTRIRFDAYDKFNTALNGTVSTSPTGDGCVK